LIAPLSIQIRRAGVQGGPNFFRRTGWPGKGLTLYRFRWQIELAFKRMKSLAGLAALPAKKPEPHKHGFTHD
jgi:hypothetical protein